jgi:hypothetical protein
MRESEMAISNVLHTVWHLIFFRALDEVFADYPGTAFQVRLWNGTTWSRTSDPKFTVILNTPEALRRLFVHPSEVGIGEAYIAGFLDVEGDMQAAFELGDYLLWDESLPYFAASLDRIGQNAIPRGSG